ncbi:hypothetical protein [Paenirhodobacter populi]|uniref:Uncharacterized protein n=1 Tax=Paenirhodobacter populi TaxID=2306993 RepID=A0A443JKK7_9RHOB|nr:hypothetical protein [Sinirhodobacter populi]RWR21125.1 hypothetical protein D2T30_09790 [Sinirhodobacter populi]
MTAATTYLPDEKFGALVADLQAAVIRAMTTTGTDLHNEICMTLVSAGVAPRYCADDVAREEAKDDHRWKVAEVKRRLRGMRQTA